MKLSIIIPAYNEEKTIPPFLKKLYKDFRESEIIVVCNGCTDNTYEVVKSLKLPNVIVLNFTEKIGKGGAILEGFKIAKNNYIGFIDADGSFNSNDIKKIIEHLKENDCVTASKWKDKNFFKVQSKFGRKIGSRVWNFLVRLFLGLDIRDTQAGLKFLKKHVYDSISHDFICQGFEFDVELLFKIKQKGFNIKEIRIDPKLINKTTFSFKNTPLMFVNLIRLWLRNLKIS